METITSTALKQRMDRGDFAAGGPAVLLDVREPDEVAAFALPGMVHIPHKQVPARMAELPRDREIVIYCKAGIRSAHAGAYLEQHGYRTTNLTGGTLAWLRAFPAGQ